MKVLINIPMPYQITIVVVLGVVFVALIIMNKSKSYKEKILSAKNSKRKVIKELLKHMDASHYLTDKTLNDHEIIGIFNTDTILSGLKAINNLENISTKLNSLDNLVLQTQIEDYINDKKYTLSSVYNVENDIYNKKKDSELMIIYYDREFSKLSKEIENAEKLKEIKKTYIQEIGDYKQKVNQLSETYEKHRKDLAKELLELNNKNSKIQDMIAEHKEKNVDSKKLYIKQFVYA